MIKIENLILQGSDKFINFNSSNVNFLDVSNNDIFDILSFNTSKIISGNIFVNDERLGIYKNDDFYIYILKIKDKEISFSVVFNLKYEIANKTISNFKKQLRVLKEKYSKNNNHNKKIIDLINLINNSGAKYVLCDLNEAKNNNYISIFKEIDFNDKIDFIFKSFNPNLIQKESPINEEIKDNGFKTILKRNYSYLFFLSLFSIFTSFCSFSSIYVIDNNNLLLGVFLTIISTIFFLLPFSIFDIFYKELISLKYNKKVKFCTFLIEFCAVLVGFSIGIGFILLLSNYDVFINLENYKIIESLLTIIFGSILLISPFISFIIFKIMSYIKIGFDKIKKSFVDKGEKDEK